MQNITISGSQLNAAFGVLMPMIVAALAGVIRQDRFPTWLNEFISYLIIIVLAIAQTWLGGTFDGTLGSLSNFILAAAWSIAVLHTKFGQQLQGSVQTATSFGKLPPEAPPLPQININVVQLAQLLRDELVRLQPIDQQPTTTMPAIVRESTPPPQQGG